MAVDNFRWLAAVVAAHPNHQVIGRTRLQKSVRLLQRLGLPSSYVFSIHFYGPYSESVKSDIRVCEQLGLITENLENAMDGGEYYILHSTENAELQEFRPFQRLVDVLAQQDSLILELAATYDAYREGGLNHLKALEKLRAKKGEKCAKGRDAEAIRLLDTLHLPAA